jgi:hypothetical protein
MIDSSLLADGAQSVLAGPCQSHRANAIFNCWIMLGQHMPGLYGDESGDFEIANLDG